MTDTQFEYLNRALGQVLEFQALVAHAKKEEDHNRDLVTKLLQNLDHRLDILKAGMMDQEVRLRAIESLLERQEKAR